jgi:hypothetical protein
MPRSNWAAGLTCPLALLRNASAVMLVMATVATAEAQQQPVQAAPPQFQPSAEWAQLPKMVLERQFSGPLQDTVIQRLHDPVDGAICYLYLPISVQHSPTTATGFVQYGPNAIGSISCMPGRLPAPPPGQRR